jgi:hypothetical protein
MAPRLMPKGGTLLGRDVPRVTFEEAKIPKLHP